MAKQYPIEKLADITKIVTEENIDALTKDLRAWLDVVVAVREAGMPGLELIESKFIWVDDNKPGVLSGLHIEIKETK